MTDIEKMRKDNSAAFYRGAHMRIAEPYLDAINDELARIIIAESEAINGERREEEKEIQQHATK